MTNKHRFPPTQKQKILLDFIQKYIREHDGIAPSFSEMSEHTSIPRGTLHSLLFQLEQRGWIERMPGLQRAIILTDDLFVRASA
jgi:DNA-binding MarR family transcriptional regulator